MADKLNLNRDQLAQFLTDHRQIRAFEKLFANIDELNNVDYSELEIAAQTADWKATNAEALVYILKENEVQQALLDAQTAIQKANEAIASLEALKRDAELVLTAPLKQEDVGVRTDYIKFWRENFYDDGNFYQHEARRLHWNDEIETLELGLTDYLGLHVGFAEMYYVKNTSGGTINKGEAVMFSGTLGASGKLTCAKLVSDGSVDHNYIMGIAAMDMDNNDFGYIQQFGQVRGVDTSGGNKTVPETWNDGDVLYSDPAYPGELTNVQPAAPALSVPIAVVIYASNATPIPGQFNGTLFVRVKTGETLGELIDVEVTTPTDKNLIAYNSSNSRWENVSAIDTDVTDNTDNLIKSSTTLLDGSGAASGTLTNAPTAGNPTKWIAIDDNGTTRYIPAW